jgi:ketosteroid isomerase-like protein
MRSVLQGEGTVDSRRIVFVLLAVGLALACAAEDEGTPQRAEADVEAVEEMVVELDKVTGEGDLEALLSFLTEDFVSLPPGEPPIVGRETLRSHHQPLFEAFELDIVHEPVETSALGEVVIQWGNCRGSFRPKGGGDAIPVDQKYLFVFKKQSDGSFKIWRLIFNNNAPADAE